jgi:hypothetical protein
MIFSAQLAGSQRYEVGDEIWQEPLADVIYAEADMIAGYASTQLLEAGMKDALRERIISEMTAALVCAGDIYQAPADVECARGDHADTLADTSSELEDPVVEQVLRLESLPLAQGGTRRAIVRWSNGSESTAISWYPEEILVCEGDLVGKTRAEIRSLQFRRDRDWLQS